MSLQKNKIYRTEIVDYTTDGSGIAKIDGMAVFIPNTAVGDQCDIRIIRVNKKIAYGRLERVIIPSTSRMEPRCPVSEKCGGCCYQHISYEAELRAKYKKVEDALQRLAGVTGVLQEIIGAPDIMRYRNKAQYPVGQDIHGTYTGFYRAHSHDIVKTKQCMIQAERADILAQEVCKWMDENTVSAYDEHHKTGLVRHIYVRTGEITGETQLCLIATSSKLPAQENLITRLRKKEPSLTGILLNINQQSNNVILGKRTITLWGEDTLQDVLCGHIFMLSPHAFYQVNHAQTERLYQCVLKLANLQGTETVIDLYCGAGTITLTLAAHAHTVLGIEIVPEAVENARQNAKKNMVENVEFICADATQAAIMLAEKGERPDVLTVDPPRKGLEVETISAIVKMHPKKVIYVSCDPATLARDLKEFIKHGYLPQVAYAYDLFPRTNHIETVIMMTSCG